MYHLTYLSFENHRSWCNSGMFPTRPEVTDINFWSSSQAEVIASLSFALGRLVLEHSLLQRLQPVLFQAPLVQFKFLSSTKQDRMASRRRLGHYSSSCSLHQAMPGDIKTEPHAKLVFKAPFSEKNRYHFTIANLGVYRIGWAIKTTNMKRLAVEPGAGVLDPKEQQMLFVTQETFSYETEDTNNHRITFEWTNAQEGTEDQFRVERESFNLPERTRSAQWFTGDGMIRRKNIPIEYNP